MKIQTKLMSSIFLIGVLVLIFFSGINYYRNRSTILKNSKVKASETANQASHYIEQLLKEKSKTAITLSQSPVITEVLEKSNAEFASLQDTERKETILSRNSKWVESKDLNDIIIKTRMHNAVADYFHKQHKVIPAEFGEIFLTNRYGVMIATTKKLTTLAHSHKYWWIEAFNDGVGRNFFDDRGYDESVGGYVLGIVVPVKKDNRVIGVLKCNINILGSVSQIIRGLEKPLFGKAKLVRSGGAIVYEEGSEPLSTRTCETIIDEMKGWTHTSIIHKKSDIEVLSSLAPVHLTKGSPQYGFGGSYKSIDHIQGNKGEGWYILVEQNVKETLVPLISMTKSIIVTEIIFVIFMVLVAMYLSRKIANPIIHLARTAEDIGMMNFTARANITSKDELGVLSASINKMVSDLKQKTTSIDDLNKEITVRRQAEENLREHEILLQKKSDQLIMALQAAKMGIFNWDIVKNDFWLSSEALDMFGATADKFDNTFEAYLDFIPSEGRDEVDKKLKQFMEEDKDSDVLMYVHKIIRGDGKPAQIEVRARFFRDNSGRPLKFSGIATDITERKQSEDNLEKSERRFQKIYELGLIGMAVTSLEKEWIQVNDRLCEILGYSAEELKKITWTELTYSEDLAADEEQYNKVLAGEIEGYSLEKRFIKKDGSIVYASISTKCIRNTDGTANHFVVLVDDITERKKAEHLLRESELLNRSALENSPVCTKIVDLDHNLQYMSSAGTQGLGIENITQYYGKPYPFDFYPESFRKTMTENLEKAGKTGEIITQEAAVFDLEKNEVWFHSTIVPVNNDKDQVEYFLVVSSDISERKKSEKERLQLSTAIEQASEIIVITNTDGMIEYVNPAFEKITGYSAKGAVGQKPSLLKSGKHDDLFYRKLWTTISRGDVWQGHFINKKKDGSHYDEEATITPVKNSKGDIINFVAIKRDVTNEIKMEEQLRQSQKMEAIGTMAGGIAHDFNNILSALIGYTELGLEDVADRPDTYSSLQQVLISADRAKDLVNQILTFSRSASTEKKPIKAKLIVSEVCKFLRSSLPANVKIRQNLTAEKDIILADATQFHQVLMNLCTNAGYAMKDSGGVLEVTLENIFLNEKDLSEKTLLETGPHLKLTVKDSGLGIKKEALARIFDPYYTNKEKGEGTGLGLAVVHGIVKDHMGDIQVISKFESGSVFTVLIPLLNQVVTGKSSQGTKSSPSGTETILFVDDEEILVSVAKMTLNRFGYKVITAFNGEDALETFKLAREAYDLVITDRTMPGMSGYELALGLRKIRPDIPVIMCSGFDKEGDKINRDKSNINGFISKPLDKKTLAFTVRRILDEKNA